MEICLFTCSYVHNGMTNIKLTKNLFAVFSGSLMLYAVCMYQLSFLYKLHQNTCSLLRETSPFPSCCRESGGTQWMCLPVIVGFKYREF
jgi:hypothetical protein